MKFQGKGLKRTPKKGNWNKNLKEMLVLPSTWPSEEKVF